MKAVQACSVERCRGTYEDSTRKGSLRLFDFTFTCRSCLEARLHVDAGSTATVLYGIRQERLHLYSINLSRFDSHPNTAPSSPLYNDNNVTASLLIVWVPGLWLGSIMARFYPIYARRSDGKVEILTKARRREPNEPTAEQLDQKPDRNGVSDFYREVAPDEPKHLDWRRKLGGMLARELAWKPKDGSTGENTTATPLLA